MKKYVKTLLLCPYDNAHYTAKYKRHEDCNNTDVLLFHSKHGGSWAEHAKGKLAAKLHSDGNGLDVTFKEKGRDVNFRLDYSQVEELFLMLKEWYLGDADKWKVSTLDWTRAILKQKKTE